MKNNKIGVIFILLCVMSNFISQIYFDTLSKTTLLNFKFKISEIDSLFLILLKNSSFYLALFFYALSALFWLLGLKSLSLAKAFSITSLNYILITLYSFYILNEGIAFNKVLSCIFITFGVVIMNKDTLLTKIKS